MEGLDCLTDIQCTYGVVAVSSTLLSNEAGMEGLVCLSDILLFTVSISSLRTSSRF